MENYSLALSLGHNSSAVLIDEDGNILVGYENERLTGVKSDSAFPRQAILAIASNYDITSVTGVYVSHWEVVGNVDNMSLKHWDKDFVLLTCPNAKIYAEYDHHDCHVEALRVFSGGNEWEIIADGFGNYNEVMSIYHNRELIHRVFGYDKSLGLLYQYATAYLGMKMNQDEYKLLGYETKIGSVLQGELFEILNEEIYKYANKYYREIITPRIVPKFDGVSGLDALVNIRLNVTNHLDALIYTKLGLKKSNLSDSARKIIIAFYIQSVVEIVIEKVIRSFDMKDVGLCGGLFMNVKLNNRVTRNVDRVSIMPLCGDNGAGLGAYQLHKGNLKWPDHLFFGIRDYFIKPIGDGIECFDNFQSALTKATQYVGEGYIVNFVHGNMEFGARALGHTSTLALPFVENVEYINRVNERSTIMPMAGMIAKSYLHHYNGHAEVIKSCGYMIVTLDQKEEYYGKAPGIHHFDPLRGVFTNRVQVVDGDHEMYPLVHAFGAVINTSFNIHGQPIVLGPTHIMKAHSFQKDRDVDDRIRTIVVVK